MKIPISKPIISGQEMRAVLNILKKGQIAQGPQVAALEHEFKTYCSSKYAVAFNSGTAAIHAALYGLGIGINDEVITTPFTFVATANPILALGAKVVFSDIQASDFSLDPQLLSQKITTKTKAIIPVDLFGQPYDYQAIKNIAKKHGLFLLEDACQATGAVYHNIKTGLLGDIGAFSFYATKNMMCGEGGMATTNNRHYAERMRQFRHHGQDQQRYQYVDIGYNYRMLDITAAIARIQLKKLDRWNKQRQKNAALLTQGLKDVPGLILPLIKKNTTHVFHQYTVRITSDFPRSREQLIASLTRAGIGAGVYYPIPLHLQPHFRNKGYGPGDFPVAEQMSKEVLSLPVHPSLKQTDIKRIVGTIKKASL